MLREGWRAGEERERKEERMCVCCVCVYECVEGGREGGRERERERNVCMLCVLGG